MYSLIENNDFGLGGKTKNASFKFQSQNENTFPMLWVFRLVCLQTLACQKCPRFG